MRKYVVWLLAVVGMLGLLPAAMGQSATLTLQSGSGSPGGPVSLSISLASDGGAETAGLQWAFSFPASITGVSVITGASAANAGKSVSCSGNNCLVFGFNSAPIANGVVAIATFQIGPSAVDSPITVQLTSMVASDPNGSSIPASGVAGAITLATLNITGPEPLPSGTVGVAYNPKQLTATGGSGGYTFSATGLPAGMGVHSTAGALGGTPAAGSQGVYNPQFRVTDSSSATTTWTQSLVINPGVLPPPSVNLITPNPVPGINADQMLTISGSGFQQGPGLKVHVSGGFVGDLSGSQVGFLSGGQLTITLNVGTVAATWNVQVINPDGQSSNVAAFVVTMQPVSRTLALPQLVAGGGWSTRLYFSNTTGSVQTFPVSFIGNDGGPLIVPLAGTGSVTSTTVTLNPSATVMLEAPRGGPELQGWAETTLPPGVFGYAVFRQSVPGRFDQEAVVPLTTEASQSADFAFDDDNLVTSLAFLNPSNQQVTASITMRFSDGSQGGITQVLLPPRSKVATTLRNLPGLSGAVGRHGWLHFSVPNGAISVLGLRFGGEAFTSIPVTHGTGTPVAPSVLPQLVSGGTWSTRFYFFNTSSLIQTFPITFIGDDGAPLNVPLTGNGSASSTTVTLGPSATAMLEAPKGDAALQGWAETTLPSGVLGYAVFRQSIPGRFDQEAVVPLITEASQSADFAFDDLSLVTSMAFLNPTNAPVTATITIYSSDGIQIGISQLVIGARSKLATILKDQPGLAASAGKRGWIRFSVPSGAISVLGLRFGGEAFTSIPVTHN